MIDDKQPLTIKVETIQEIVKAIVDAELARRGLTERRRIQ